MPPASRRRSRLGWGVGSRCWGSVAFGVLPQPEDAGKAGAAEVMWVRVGGAEDRAGQQVWGRAEEQEEGWALPRQPPPPGAESLLSQGRSRSTKTNIKGNKSTFRFLCAPKDTRRAAGSTPRSAAQPHTREPRFFPRPRKSAWSSGQSEGDGGSWFCAAPASNLCRPRGPGAVLAPEPPGRRRLRLPTGLVPLSAQRGLRGPGPPFSLTSGPRSREDDCFIP